MCQLTSAMSKHPCLAVLTLAMHIPRAGPRVGHHPQAWPCRMHWLCLGAGCFAALISVQGRFHHARPHQAITTQRMALCHAHMAEPHITISCSTLCGRQPKPLPTAPPLLSHPRAQPSPIHTQPPAMGLQTHAFSIPPSAQITHDHHQQSPPSQQRWGNNCFVACLWAGVMSLKCRTPAGALSLFRNPPARLLHSNPSMQPPFKCSNKRSAPHAESRDASVRPQLCEQGPDLSRQAIGQVPCC